MPINSQHLKKILPVVLNFLIIAAYTVLPVMLFYTEFEKHHRDLPAGCDEFGYLNMAKAITQNKLFKNHAERPFDKELLDYLRNTYPNPEDYTHLIAPHAYHYDAKASRVINQYPPGTSLLLSVFPINSRKPIFPAMCTFLLIMFILMVFKINLRAISMFNLGIMVIILSFFLFLFSVKLLLLERKFRSSDLRNSSCCRIFNGSELKTPVSSAWVIDCLSHSQCNTFSASIDYALFLKRPFRQKDRQRNY